MAKFSEIGRSERQPPGCIKPVAVLQAHKQAAAWGKDINEAESGAKIYKGFALVLFRVCYVQVVTTFRARKLLCSDVQGFLTS